MQTAETTGRTTRTTEDVPNANNRCHCGAEADGVDATSRRPICSHCAADSYSGKRFIADGGVRWFDLTGFRLRLLWEISQLDQPSGQTIRRRIEERTDDTINHGKLYPNLDDLVNKGLVEKGDQDQRTNYYEVTNDGQRVVDKAADDFQQVRTPAVIADGGEEVDE